MDASGAVVVDAIVYGSQQSSSSGNGTIASPEIATLEADQGKGGCIAVVPSPARGFGPPAPSDATNRSVDRFPDGADTDSLCHDFLMQSATTLLSASSAGATNIKVASVADFSAGQAILIDSSGNVETAVIAAVGTAGTTTTGAPTIVGTNVIPVAGVAGFGAGQTITVDGGANQETAVIASVAGGGRGGRGGPGAGATITVAAPLTLAHAAGAQVSGSGITLAKALTKTHESGARVAGGVPTPGAPNQYSARRN